MDLNYMAKHSGSEDVYASFNLVMRRKPKVGAGQRHLAALTLALALSHQTWAGLLGRAGCMGIPVQGVDCSPSGLRTAALFGR
jgi:hypothetical protein